MGSLITTVVPAPTSDRMSIVPRWRSIARNASGRPESIAVLLGRKIEIEDARQILGRDARAFVRHDDFHKTAMVERGRDPDRPAFCHRFSRVTENIPQGLGEQRAISLNRPDA